MDRIYLPSFIPLLLPGVNSGGSNLRKINPVTPPMYRPTTKQTTTTIAKSAAIDNQNYLFAEIRLVGRTAYLLSTLGN